MWTLLGVATVAALLVTGGYLLGAQGFRKRGRELSATLAQRNEELQAARTELRHRSSLDGLTELATHQYAQEFLEREWRRALRELKPVSVILADIDHFQSYNQRLGHEAGDACLKRIATVLRDIVNRPGDLIARYGGEEFLIVLGRTDGEGAESLATKLQAAVEGLELPHPASEVADRVTISLGVAAAFPTRGATWQDIELVVDAERALSDAKRQGRNRVVRDAGPGTTPQAGIAPP